MDDRTTGSKLVLFGTVRSFYEPLIRNWYVVRLFGTKLFGPVRGIIPYQNLTTVPIRNGTIISFGTIIHGISSCFK